MAKRPHMTLLNRIVLFLIAFAATLLVQMGISNYQTQSVLEPLEERTESIQSISQFLNEMEGAMVALEDYRWDYGDAQTLIETLRVRQLSSVALLERIDSDLGEVSEEQYLLANAAKTTYSTFSETVDEIITLLESGRKDAAASLYYSDAEPCGGYVRQYTQQLLERAIQDNQSTYSRLSRLNADLKRGQNIVMILCIVLGTIVVISLFALLRSVKDMAAASRAISQGDLDAPDVDETLEDEIGDMAKAFNEMKRSMKRQVQLLGERNEMERELHKKETEALELQNLMEREQLQRLRSQINPHFLFNTLNVIMYTARQENAGRTQSLLGSLSQLFRYSLGSNEDVVALSREVHIVNEYFKLQHVRFGDRIGMEWVISPELALTETLVPSFILQPLVENAFKHGLAPKEEGGRVVVRIWQEEKLLYISVADDGVGMSGQTLADLRAHLQDPSGTGEHIGLYNVAARLRLRGREYGLDVVSEEGKGTCATMRLRLVTTEEEGEETDD